MVRSLIGGESGTLEIAEGQKNPEEQAEPFMQYREILKDMFGRGIAHILNVIPLV